MKNRKIWIIAAGLVAIAAITWMSLRSARSAAPVYRQAALERGSVEATISATGKLGAVTTVQVGTQVSGQVAAIYADFNSHVKKNQIIARIDPTLAQQAVREAQAGLERDQADLDKAQRDYTRDKQLHDRQIISDSDFSTSSYAFEVAKANFKTGQVAVDRAQRNLTYTAIRAPIDGIVIERDVDVGQTVAASLSAPQIFLIANDLSQLQILASVDEGDISKVHEGMPVRFTVQSAPRDSFAGVVSQLRLQSTITENVVNYTVVIAVQNPNGKLLPGMTATVSFLVGTATNVFVVPNAALRIRPTPEMLAETGSSKAAVAIAKNAASGAGGGAGSGVAGGGAGAGGGARRARGAGGTGSGSSQGLLWYLKSDGKLAKASVRIGLSDGQRTEVSGKDLVDGMQVVIGVTMSATSKSATATSPFQQQSGSGGGGPRGGGF